MLESIRVRHWDPSLSTQAPCPGPEILPHPPVGRPPLSVLVDVQQEFGGVDRGGGARVQQQLLVLGQVLGRVLLGQPGTVEQLPLKERQVGLRETRAT